jgi:hypothetical protein
LFKKESLITGSNLDKYFYKIRMVHLNFGSSYYASGMPFWDGFNQVQGSQMNQKQIYVSPYMTKE